MFEYKGMHLEFQISEFATNGALAISLTDEEGPYARLSVNLDDRAMAALPTGCFYLKNWSENEAIADHLLRMNLLSYVNKFGESIDYDDVEEGVRFPMTAIAGQTWAYGVRITPEDDRCVDCSHRRSHHFDTQDRGYQTTGNCLDDCETCWLSSK